ncbi:MAG: hypothetical protein FWC90_01180 [Oscillospiraceae bacterium]|nr:hypothetical protein [Oscillospiraceae bacterium]
MMTRKKIREVAKVATMTVLSIALFSTALMGVNSWAFARATNSTHSFPLPTEAVEVAANLPPEGFVPPDVTISASPWQHYHEISAQAMSMEEAAQIGAEYIWEVFGTCIDGMHIEMRFGDWDWLSRTIWQGSVYASEQVNIAARANDSTMHQVLTRNPDADITVYLEESLNTRPLYSFSIDAVTGMRTDIHYHAPSDINVPNEYFSREDAMAWRAFMTELGWFDMDVYEQLTYTGLSPEQLEVYTQMAEAFAQRHFNNSEIVEVRLERLASGPSRSARGSTVALTGFFFIITDDTGREAAVSISAESSPFNSISISTQHNDFVPDFEGASGGVG